MPNPAWMAAIPNNNIRLREIVMPGSHDAGVSDVHHANKNMGFFVGANGYICQAHDIAGQLDAGARFFDIRFDMKNGVPTTVHETAGSGGWGESAASVFAAINAHLLANNQEFVIVRVSHTDARTGAAVYAAQGLHLHLNRMYTSGVQNNLANFPIRAFRGRAIVAYASDAMANPNPVIGQIRFGKASNANRGGIVTCGEYPNSNNMELIRYKSVKRINEHRTFNCNDHAVAPHRNHLFQLYWQMTGGNIRENTLRGVDALHPIPPFPGPMPAFNAHNGTHYNLTYLIRAILSGGAAGTAVNHAHFGRADGRQVIPPPDINRCQWVPNIINMDFINDAVCSRIITFNTACLTAAGLWIAAP